MTTAGESGLVGVVLPHVGRWWFGEVLAGLDSVLRPAGHDLLLSHLPDAATRLKFFQALPSQRRVDALAVVALPMTANEIAILRGLGIPTGCVGIRTPGITSVAIDEARGARIMSEHLLALGHRRIALIGGDPHEPFKFTVARERRNGYRFALHSHGVWPHDELDVPGYWTARGAVAATHRLLALPEPPTAIFAMSDEMAVGVLHALRQAGLRVPEDVSVAGFDDHPDAQVFELTTIAQPAHDCGVRLASLLVTQLLSEDRSSGSRVEHMTHTSTRLVIRGSTGPAPAG